MEKTYRRLKEPHRIEVEQKFLHFYFCVCLVALVAGIVAQITTVICAALLMIIGMTGGLIFSFRRHKDTRWFEKNIRTHILENELYIDDANQYYFPETYIAIDVEQNRVEIKFRLAGNKIDLRNLEVSLGDRLERDYGEPKEERGYIIYYFEYEREEPIIISSREELRDANTGEYEISLSPSLTWNFRKSPGFTVVGTTGSGKSVFASILMEKLTTKGCLVKFASLKIDRDMRFFVESNGSTIGAFFIDELIEMVKDVYHEMEEREKLIWDMGLDKDFEFSFRPIFLVIDEAILLKKRLTEIQYKTVMNMVEEIVISGRDKLIFCGILCQSSHSDWYGKSTYRSNLGLKVYLGNASSTEIGMLFGEENSSCKNLDHREFGSGLIMTSSSGRPRQFIAPFIKKGVFE